MIYSQTVASALAALVIASVVCAAPPSDMAPRSSDNSRSSAPTPPHIEKRLIVGQDLGAIRDYARKPGLAPPDGATAYIGLYNLFSEDEDYGGLGLNPAGQPIDLEGDWGAGPVSAHKTIAEFGYPDLAIGLFIADNDRPNGMSELVKGDHDDKIRHLARLFKYVEGTVFLRIGYEFDGNWNRGYEDTERYKEAFRRIVRIIREEGADNIATVWQASASTIDDIIERKSEDISDWYPGDEYVDWIGLSWFMNPDEMASVPLDGFKPPTPRMLADEVLAFARSRNKPVMIAEAAPQAFDIDAMTTSHHSPLWDGEAGSARKKVTEQAMWDEWFAPLFKYMADNHDVIHILAYINCDWESQEMWGPPYASGYWGDTRVSVNNAIAKRWNQAVAQWRKDGSNTKTN